MISTRPMLISNISNINFGYLFHQKIFHKLPQEQSPWTSLCLQKYLYKLALFLRNQKILHHDYKHHLIFYFKVTFFYDLFYFYRKFGRRHEVLFKNFINFTTRHMRLCRRRYTHVIYEHT